MATDDTILTEDSLSRRPEGVAIALKVPWYRSLWLSSVSDVRVVVEGREIPRDELRAELKHRSYRIEELPEQWDVLWFLQDRLEIVVPLDPPPEAGEKVQVEVTLDLRLPYMQIAPMRYVTNHATNARALAVH
jgi:Domain of unknown function (DUF6379)